MLSTGVEMTTLKGKIANEPALGDFFSYMVKVLEGGLAALEGPDPFVEIQFTGENIKELIKQAEFNPIARNAAEELAALFLEKQGKIPTELVSLAIQNLRQGKAQRKKGRDLLQNWHRDRIIIMLLSAFENSGFSPMTRNSESTGDNKKSLCDLMVSALESIGAPLSYETVKTIWGKRKKLKDLIPIFRASIEETVEGATVCYIGYADKNKVKDGIAIESQNCWSLKRLILRPAPSPHMQFHSGKRVDIGNSEAFILFYGRQGYFTKRSMQPTSR